MKSCIELTDVETLFEKMRELKTDGLIFLVDEKVWKIFGESEPFKNLENRLEKKIIFLTLPEGEKSKSWDIFQSTVEHILKEGIHRNYHLIAFGGGALSDLSGFVASVLLRGISWSVIPTTLLSMVDASIGGKTAINSSLGKNLIGAFHKPKNIWLNPMFLESLPLKEKLNGWGEVIKYGFLNNEIFSSLGRNDKPIGDIIHLCASYKSDLTEKDFKELGPRKYLNLGHTLGHAFEKIYCISHGEAVYWGMKAMFQLFEREDLLNKLDCLGNYLNLPPMEAPWLKEGVFSVAQIMDYVRRDKKVIDRKTIELVLVEDVGRPFIKKFNLEFLEERLLFFKGEFLSGKK